MSLPFFFTPNLNERRIVLDEDMSKHMISVLRMVNGEEVLLTDGKGKKARAIIVDDNRKKCAVEISSTENEERSTPNVCVAISLIKNASRFEWFLEKATEIGVTEIIPLICERTEKEKFRHDRLQQILVSAMLQSQQAWLPVLHDPTQFSKIIGFPAGQKFIAHCIAGEEKPSLSSLLTHKIVAPHHSTFSIQHSFLILIGPEGDFRQEEINLALEHSFLPVALGSTRLRTETAGIVAATVLKFSGR
jgi:16S rRNA (uracil1498-N3)-methyltransferase